MRVLLTNITLSTRSGTEYFTRDLATALRRRGHQPMVFTPDPGAVADELRAAGVEVAARFDALSAEPEVIHGHHAMPLMAALAWFADAPGLFVVHDRVQWTDEPPRHPRLRRYVAVDDCCRERLCEAGLPEPALSVILNAVDLDRFRPRPPLPPALRRALLFSNYADPRLAATVEAACAPLGIDLQTAGAGIGRVHPRPEDLLGQYDLVFGKARCALEALAVGCAVVVCDVAGIGGLVTPANFARLRRLNFGRRTQVEPVGETALVREIGRYDPHACAEVSRMARAEAGLDSQVAQFEALYRAILAEPRVASDAGADARAQAAWLATALPAWRDWSEMWRDRERLRAEAADAAAQHEEADVQRAAAARWAAEAAEVAIEAAKMRNSAAWRLGRRILGFPGVASTMLSLERWPGRRPAAPMPVIVGVPRSGTTLLRLMLDAHRVLAIPPETGFVAVAATRPDEHGTAKRLASLIREWPTWSDFHLSEAALRAELEQLDPFNLADGVRAFYRLYASRFGKPRWGEKSPGYGLSMAAIGRLLPEARFVHLMRDGRDVAVSLRRQWFSPGGDMTRLAGDWVTRIETARAQATEVAHYLEIRFEDLVRDPEPVLCRVCDFLDLSFDRAMLEHHRGAAARLAEHEAMFDGEGRVVVDKARRLAQQRSSAFPPDPSLIGRYRDELTAAEIAEFESVAGTLLCELGYAG